MTALAKPALSITALDDDTSLDAFTIGTLTGPVIAVAAPVITAAGPAMAVTALAEPTIVIAVLAEPTAAGTTEELLRQRDALAAGDPARTALRTRAIEMNLATANRLARRYTGRGELFDDLAQVASLALVKAVDGYDPTRGVPFVGYAFPYILGALKRHFRDTTWAMRVPRSAQELARQVVLATDELSHQQSRTPTRAEVAAHLNVTMEDLRLAIGASQVYHLTSLNAPHPGSDAADLIELVGDVDPHYGRVDAHVTLRPLLAALPLRERRILTMRYQDQMTQVRIAEAVGLSQMHVSRLLKRSLDKLRSDLAA